MTVYTDEVNIYNTDAIAQDIQEAHDAHKAYITDVSADNGIVVAAAGKGTVNGAITSATTGWHLADVLEFIKQGVSRFWIGLKNQTDSTPTVRIGKEYVSGATDNESHMELDYHSMQLIDREGNTYFHVSDLRDTNGNAELTSTFIGNGTTKSFSLSPSAKDTDYTVTVSDSSGGTVQKTTSSITFSSAPTTNAKIVVTYTTKSNQTKAYTFGVRMLSDTDIGGYSIAEGYKTTASGFTSHTEGYYTTASGAHSHAEGSGAQANGYASHAEGDSAKAYGYASHAEGMLATASGIASHAEGGGDTTAQGDYSHAEGYDTQASKEYAHAEGYMTEARGQESHAEGNRSKAIGNRSHAQNECTVAGHADQTTIGKYNDNQSDNAFEIGNGDGENARSNAFAVDWNGNVEAAGNTVHAAYASAITSTTISATNTAKQIPITSIYDGGSPDYFVHASNGIKVLKAGTYIISMQATSSNATSGDLMGLHVYKNGSSIIGPEYRRMGGTYDTVVIAPTMATLSEGDVLTVYGRNNTAARGTFSSLRMAVIRL